MFQHTYHELYTLFKEKTLHATPFCGLWRTFRKTYHRQPAKVDPPKVDPTEEFWVIDDPPEEKPTRELLHTTQDIDQVSLVTRILQNAGMFVKPDSCSNAPPYETAQPDQDTGQYGASGVSESMPEHTIGYDMSTAPDWSPQDPKTLWATQHAQPTHADTQPTHAKSVWNTENPQPALEQHGEPDWVSEDRQPIAVCAPIGTQPTTIPHIEPVTVPIEKPSTHIQLPDLTKPPPLKDFCQPPQSMTAVIKPRVPSHGGTL